jgi:hypothetical protein
LYGWNIDGRIKMNVMIAINENEIKEIKRFCERMQIR